MHCFLDTVLTINVIKLIVKIVKSPIVLTAIFLEIDTQCAQTLNCVRERSWPSVLANVALVHGHVVVRLPVVSRSGVFSYIKADGYEQLCLIRTQRGAFTLGVH